MPIPRFAPHAALGLLFCLSITDSFAAADANWSAYLGDKAASHYSTLSDITPDNVSRLEVAWTWNAGDARGNQTMQTIPVTVDSPAADAGGAAAK